MIDPRVLKALAHPTRIHILDILSEGPNSPSGIQRRIDDISLNLVGHHIKVLRELGFIELIEVVPRRGAKEHIYKATERQFFTAEEWEAVDYEQRVPVTATIMRVISEDVGRAFLDGKFDETTDNHLSRTPLEVDEEGWGEVVAALKETLEKVLAAEEKSKERAQAGDLELLALRVIMMQFPFKEHEPK